MTKPDRISLAEVARQTGAMLRRGDSAHYKDDQQPTLADLTESLFFSPATAASGSTTSACCCCTARPWAICAAS